MGKRGPRSKNFDRDNEMISRYINEGLTMRELGNIYGVTFQRAQQIVGAYSSEAAKKRVEKFDAQVADLPLHWSCERKGQHLGVTGATVVAAQRRLGITTEDMTIARFYSRISDTPTETGCIEWLGGKNKVTGYGRFIGRSVFGRQYHVHRQIWMLEVGEIPDGKFICHSCDNPICVNIEHLSLGSPADNVRDRDSRGRHKIVSGLCDEVVVDLRRRANRGEELDYEALGEEYDAHPYSVYRAVSGQTFNGIGE